MDRLKYQKLKCEECGNEFVWSAEEQLIYQKRGLSKPKYCPICRGIMEAYKRDQARINYEVNKNKKEEK